MDNTAKLPPGRGNDKDLLPNMLDTLAVKCPNKTWGKIPKSTTTYEDGFRNITYRELANSVDFLKDFIERKVGISQGQHSLAYMGPWDPRFSMLILAASKTGYKLILPAPTQAVEAIVHLLQEVNCKTLLSSRERLPIVTRLLNSYDCTVCDIPCVSEILAAEPEPHASTKQSRIGRGEPLCVLHTSGSTGFPKPITLTQDWAASFIQQLHHLPPSGFESQEKMWHGAETLAVVPPYHTSSTTVCLYIAFGTGSVTIFPLPNATMSMDTVVKVLENTNCNAVCVAPHIIDQLSQDEKALDFVASNISVLTYAGGPALQSAGDLVSAKTKLIASYGNTESGLLPCIRPTSADGTWDPSLWRSFHFHPKANTQMRPFGKNDANGAGGDLHELIVKRNPDPEDLQPVFKFLSEDVPEWSTKDLFVPDPKHPGFWIHSGRIDDVLIFATGAKYDPNAFEQTVASHPLVKDAVMVGNGKPVAALIVEPTEEAKEKIEGKAEVLNEIWPNVEEANKMSKYTSRISRDRVVVAGKGNPLPRTAKGTVAKSRVFEVYREELEQLYKAY